MSDFEYQGVRRVVYGEDRAQFVPVCQQCGRYVKAPDTMTFDHEAQPVTPNAQCSQCGPTQMLWEGYY